MARSAGLTVSCDSLQRLAAAILDQAPRVVHAVARAPHVAHRLLRRAGRARADHAGLARIQRIASEAVEDQLRGLGGSNVRDGAALVVDNASGDILAYVASAGPASTAAQVDGVRARRQAGSTLKPFLYGLALERRYLTAASLLDDSPLQLETGAGLYVPQNYDRDFKGLVSVRTALASSLNIPAIRTLIMTGLERARDRLRDHGYLGITQPGEYYGYSLALGSAEVSLLEQVTAYRSLANGGRAGPLRLAATDPRRADSGRSSSPQAAFIIADILGDKAGRAVTFGLHNPLTTRYWSAVKTGTSKDMRDNWCIGFSERYTVGVWVGNFEGDSMRDVSGVSGAAPAWLAIMNALHAELPSRAPQPPVGVVAQQLSFEPPLEPTRREWFIAGTEADGGAAGRSADPAAADRFAAAGRRHRAGSRHSRGQPAGPVQRPPGRRRAALRARRRSARRRGRCLQMAARTGAHTLVLQDAAGTVRDTVSFQVRAPRR